MVKNKDLSCGSILHIFDHSMGTTNLIIIHSFKPILAVTLRAHRNQLEISLLVVYCMCYCMVLLATKQSFVQYVNLGGGR